MLDLTRDVVMGHEFCAEVVDYGPSTSGAVRPGDRVVSMPLLFRGGRYGGRRVLERSCPAATAS